LLPQRSKHPLEMGITPKASTLSFSRPCYTETDRPPLYMDVTSTFPNLPYLNRYAYIYRCIERERYIGLKGSP